MLNVSHDLVSSLIILSFDKSEKCSLWDAFFKKWISKIYYYLLVFHDQVEKNNPFLICVRDWHKSYFDSSVFFLHEIYFSLARVIKITFLKVLFMNFTLFALQRFRLSGACLFRTDTKALLKSKNSALFILIFNNLLFSSSLNWSFYNFFFSFYIRWFLIFVDFVFYSVLSWR